MFKYMDSVTLLNTFLSCNASGTHEVAFEEYGRMRDALNQVCHAANLHLSLQSDIYYHIRPGARSTSHCAAGIFGTHRWAGPLQTAGASLATATNGPASLLQSCLLHHIFNSTNAHCHIYSTNKDLYNDARPGGWNDPDMLVGSSPEAAVFNTPAQSRTQFSLWCIMAAPLLIGSNMLNMTVRQSSLAHLCLKWLLAAIRS